MKVKDFLGYGIELNETSGKFVLRGPDGNDLATAPSLELIEGKAKSIAKGSFKRIPFVSVAYNGKVTTGEVTSVNLDDGVCWIGGEGGRSKIILRYAGRDRCEATPRNVKLAEQCAAINLRIDDQLAQVREIRDLMEKPLNDSYWSR